MKDTFPDKFGRDWVIVVTKHDPAPYSRNSRFYKVSAETLHNSLSFNFFAAFDDINEAIHKAKTFADLLPYV